MRRKAWLVLVLFSVLACAPSPVGAVEFASPLFRIEWLQGEGIVQNFWGPSGTEAFTEAYVEAPGGQRTVQYFDKGRMELTDPATGRVTNGLLAKELVSGNQQIGNTTWVHHEPPAIPLAGDQGGVGPTYALLSSAGAPLFAPTPMRGEMPIAATFNVDGTLTMNVPRPDAALTVRAYDAMTQHNVLGPFADFRRNVGLDAIGYALSEPFLATFTVGGVPKTIAVQIFERRVLTYTASNPDPFKTEFSNIGRHYFTWRYH